MSAPIEITADMELRGDVNMTGTGTLPLGSVTNATVAGGANINENKIQHRIHSDLRICTGTWVTAKTELVYIAYCPGDLLEVTAGLVTAPTGNYTITIDVKKSTAGGAFASVLSTELELTSASISDRDILSGSLSGTPTFITDDLLQIVVTTSGSSGTQGIDLLVSAVIGEDGTT